MFFCTLDKSEIHPVISFMRSIFNVELFVDSMDKLVVLKKAERLEMTKAGYDTFAILGYGQPLYSNDFTVTGVGHGYIENVDKVAKSLKLMVAQRSSMFLLPALLARAGHDLLLFREMLRDHVDGNFGAALWSNNRLVLVNSTPLALGHHLSTALITHPMYMDKLNDVRLVRPYSISCNGRVMSWRNVSQKPVYMITDEQDLARALKHSRMYSDFAFMKPGAKTIEGLENYTVLSTGGHGYGEIDLGFHAAEVIHSMQLRKQSTTAYDAIVYCDRIVSPDILRMMTDTYAAYGNLKNFSFLDYTRHVVP